MAAGLGGGGGGFEVATDGTFSTCPTCITLVVSLFNFLIWSGVVLYKAAIFDRLSPAFTV